MPNARKVADGSVWKICPTCNRDQPIAGFSRCVSKSDGMQTFCKACAKIQQEKYKRRFPDKRAKTVRRWSRRNRERIRERRRQRNFRMKPGDYLAMVERQGNKCGLCLKPASACCGKTLNVDHCHQTGRVRGLLCKQCNMLLGQVDDSVETLKRMISYLVGEA